jgi:hypothetical protein
MAKELFVPHYDVSFKRMVIEEYLSTGCTKAYLLKNNVPHPPVTHPHATEKYAAFRFSFPDESPPVAYIYCKNL